MSDLLDDADTLQAEHLARSLARVDATIPAGVAGICDDCGEDMPRLVGGRCGYCRDGRPHPFERTRQATGAPARAPAPAPVKETPMPNAPDKKAINIVVHRDLFAAIERAAAKTGATPAAFTRSAVEAALGTKPPQPAIDPRIDLDKVPLPDLLDAICTRVGEASTREDDLLARATAAEAKLTAIGGLIAPAGAGA